MTDSVERLLVRIDATTESLRRELRRADESVTRSQKVIDKRLKQIDDSFGRLRRSVSGKLAGLFTVAGISLFTRSVLQASDSVAKMRGQLGLVTDSQAELNSAYAEALRLANATGQSTEATVTLYSRLAKSTEELNLSQSELFRLTETINKSFVVQGATAQEASAAIIQLTQAFGKGRLDGQELNAVLEQATPIARAMAEELGIAFGELKDAGSEGRITIDVMISALEKLGVKVDEQFENMPVTINRAFQELSNNVNNALGQIDTGQLVDSIQELSAVVSDPRMVAGLENLAAGAASLATWIVKLSAAAGNGASAMGEFYARLFGADDTGGSVEAMVAEYNRLAESIATLEKNGTRSKVSLTKQKNELAKLKAVLEITGDQIVMVNGRWQLLDSVLSEVTVSAKRWDNALEETNKSSEKSAKLTKEQVKAFKEAEKVVAQWQKVAQASADSINEGVEEYDEIIAATDEYIEGLEFQISLVGLSAREQAILTAEHERGAKATEEQREAIARLTGELYDARAATEAAAAAQKPFQDALQGTIERIDTITANAWDELFRFDDNAFSNFKDRFFDSIRRMFAELAHINITRPIFQSVVGSLGFGAASSAGAAGSVVGGGGGGVSGLLSGGGGLTGNFLTGAEGFFASNGMPGVANVFYNAQTGLASTGALVGGGVGAGGLITGGAGIVGGLVGSQIFGETSGIGSTIGGAAGGILGASSLTALGAAAGPVGAAVGALAGVAIESFLGGKNNGDNKGRVTLDLGSGVIPQAQGVGKSFNQANVDALNEIVPSLVAISNALGGSSAVLDLSIGNNSGLSLNGEKFGKDDAGFIAAAIDAMLEGATGLSKDLKTLIQSFDGTSDELINFSTAMINITQLLEDNPVDRAVEDFAASQEFSGRRILDVYADQLQALGDLIDGFDGSADGALTLNAALASNKQLAYEMALALEAIGASTQQVVQDQVNYFNEATRTPDQNLQFMQGQLEFLDYLLPRLTDPDQILAARDKALELNQAIFDAGPQDLQAANVQTFIDMANQIGDSALMAAENASVSLAATQETLNQQMASTIQDAITSGFAGPAEKIDTAADKLLQAAQLLLNGGYSNVTA